MQEVFFESARESNTCTAVREKQDHADQEVEMYAVQFQQESQRVGQAGGRPAHSPLLCTQQLLDEDYQ